MTDQASRKDDNVTLSHLYHCYLCRARHKGGLARGPEGQEQQKPAGPHQSPPANGEDAA